MTQKCCHSKSQCWKWNRGLVTLNVLELVKTKQKKKPHFGWIWFSVLPCNYIRTLMGCSCIRSRIKNTDFVCILAKKPNKRKWLINCFGSSLRLQCYFTLEQPNIWSKVTNGLPILFERDRPITSCPLARFWNIPQDLGTFQGAQKVQSYERGSKFSPDLPPEKSLLRGQYFPKVQTLFLGRACSQCWTYLTAQLLPAFNFIHHV